MAELESIPGCVVCRVSAPGPALQAPRPLRPSPGAKCLLVECLCLRVGRRLPRVRALVGRGGVLGRGVGWRIGLWVACRTRLSVTYQNLQNKKISKIYLHVKLNHSCRDISVLFARICNWRTCIATCLTSIFCYSYFGRSSIKQMRSLHSFKDPVLKGNWVIIILIFHTTRLLPPATSHIPMVDCYVIFMWEWERELAKRQTNWNGQKIGKR